MPCDAVVVYIGDSTRHFFFLRIIAAEHRHATLCGAVQQLDGHFAGYSHCRQSASQHVSIRGCCLSVGPRSICVGTGYGDCSVLRGARIHYAPPLDTSAEGGLEGHFHTSSKREGTSRESGTLASAVHHSWFIFDNPKCRLADNGKPNMLTAICFFRS